MARPFERRLPLEPLLDVCGGGTGGGVAHFLRRHPEIALNGSLRRSLYPRDGRRPGLTVGAADRIATAIGVHPAQIWRDWA